MINCPYCDHENIEGADECDECGQPLDDTHLAPPRNELEHSLLHDHIGVLSPKAPVTVARTTPIRDVLRLMVEHRIGCVVVADGARPLGIFSERDALRKIGAEGPALAARPVGEFMTPDPQTLRVDAKIAFAVQRMDLGGYRHLPVVSEQGDLVGIISARDILRHLMENLARGN